MSLSADAVRGVVSTTTVVPTVAVTDSLRSVPYLVDFYGPGQDLLLPPSVAALICERDAVGDRLARRLVPNLRGWPT